MYTNLNNPANYQLQDFGQFGFRVLDSSSMVVDGETYRTLYVLDDAVVSATSAKADDLVSKALLAGTLLHGLFSAPSVTSGKVLAYMAGRLTAQEILDLYKAYLDANGGKLELESETLSKLQALGTDDYADASLVFMPSGYKTSVLFSERPMDTDGQIAFSRASNATRVDANGLVEKVRTNLLLQSEAFNTTWSTYAGTTVTANAVSAPNGTLTADRIQGTSAASRGVYQIISSSAIPHTFSVYLKSATGSSTTCRIWVDSDASIVTVTNDWQRFSVTGITAASFGQFTITSAASSAIDVYAWGAQVETGDIATDYIPTTTSARSTFAGTTVDGTSVPNLPRIDYSGTEGALLLEPQRTNSLTYSEQFDNADWVKTGGVSFTANYGISPDGYQNADLLYPNSTGVNRESYKAYGYSSGLNYSFSVYAKAGGLNWVFIGTDYIGGGKGAWFNLSTGVVGTQTSGYTATIENAGNGYYRCIVSYNQSVASNYYTVILTDADNSFSVTKNGTDGILIWGAQVEQGAYATSYIPTLASSVTRVADEASKTGVSNLIGQTEGTLFADFEIDGDLNATRIVFIVSSVGAADFVVFFISGGLLYARMRATSGGALIDVTKSGFTIGRHKVAVGYAANDLTLYLDGVFVGQNTSASVAFTSPLSVMDVGQNTAAINQLGGEISQALLFKTRLTNDKLAALTTL